MSRRPMKKQRDSRRCAFRPNQNVRVKALGGEHNGTVIDVSGREAIVRLWGLTMPRVVPTADLRLWKD